MAVNATAHTDAARNALEKILSRVRPEDIDRIVRSVAARTVAALVAATPKKWTGQTRREWRVIKSGRGYLVTNLSKVMLFLEEGTKDHGPVTAHVLFIPLTRSAAMNGWSAGLTRGTDYLFAMRVRGIRARKIVERQRPLTIKWLQDEFAAYLRSLTS